MTRRGLDLEGRAARVPASIVSTMGMTVQEVNRLRRRLRELAERIA
ncbi:hypothetical protein [Couchioplanes caeruleus]|nr:hypothetical protein [Couchioplanes caeruleus]